MYHQHHRHHRQILGDEDGDGDAAGLGLGHADVVQHLDGDGGRAQRHHEAEQHRKPQGPAKQSGQAEHDGEGPRDLQQRTEQRRPPHLLEGGNRQFHADEEQQHQHAEIGEGIDLVPVLDQAAGGGTEDDAGEDVTDDGGLAEPRHDHAANQRGQSDDGDGGEL